MDAAALRPNVYDDADAKRVLRDHIDRDRNLGSVMIAQEAERAGATVTWIDRDFAVAAFAGHRTLLYQNRATELSSAMALAADKHVTKQLLQGAGVPTPQGTIVTSANEAVTASGEFPEPVVIKPASGLKGRGITVGVSETADVEQAFHHARVAASRVLVEECVYGEEYRCLVTPTECISVVARIPPWVAGDGTSTIRALIDHKNTARRMNPHLHQRPIKINVATEDYLARQGRSLDVVPAAGERVVLSNVANFSNGGESFECASWVVDAVKQVASAACAAIPGLEWAGVDVIAEPDNQTVYVLEVNSSAVIASHQYPLYGQPQNVAAKIWQVKDATSRQTAKPAGHVSSDPLQPAWISGYVPGTAEVGDDTRLSALLTGVLVRHGYTFEHVSRVLVKATGPDGAVQWLHRSRAADDPAVAYAACRRHGVIRRLLRLAHVRRPPAKRVRSVNELTAFANATGSGAFLVPYNAAWGSTKQRYAAPDEVQEDVFAAARSLIAQRHLEGRRFTVVASAHQSLAALTTSVQAADAGMVQAASQAAVRAVQAVPGLECAAVDVVVRTRNGEPASVAVEGFPLDPVITPGHMIVEGSLAGAALAFVTRRAA